MTSSPTMTAAVTHAHGGPEVVEVRTDWPRPVAGAGEALVAVSAAAVNTTDLWSREGAYGRADDPGAVAGWQGIPLAFPRIQGGDIAGVVVEVGPGVDRGLVGRRVVVDPAAEYVDGRPATIVGSEIDGGFAEFHVAAVHQLHDLTDSPLDDRQLACLPIAYGTALGMIERAGCTPSERVLVTAASGGVGLAAVHLLGALGCRVVAVTTAEKAATVAHEGANEIVVRDRDDVPDVDEVDVVLDLVGGDGFGDVVNRLRDGGRLVTAGAIAGPVVELDLRRVYLRHRALLGSTMHSPGVFRRLMALARNGAVRPRVAARFPLRDLPGAHQRFLRKDFVGKIVVEP